MTKLRFEGVTQSVEEWAADYGIPCKLIHSRLKRGWSVERAITEPMQVRRGDKLKAADLQDVQPIPAPAPPVASKLKLTPKLPPRLKIMSPRLRPRAQPKRPASAKSRGYITFDGRTLSMQEWADELGITRTALYERLRKGWPLERALTEQSVQPATRAPVYACNGETLTLSEWAAKLDIPKNTLAVRLGRYGWTVEAAFSVPVRPKAASSMKVSQH